MYLTIIQNAFRYKIWDCQYLKTPQGLHNQYLYTHKITERSRQKFLKVIKKSQNKQMQHEPILSPMEKSTTSPHFPLWSSLGDEAVYRS